MIEANANDVGQIDTNLYSRQIGAFGLETMGKLIQLNVLIIGLRGAGIETAKNIILAGPKSVTLLDDGLVEARDMGTNFYVSDVHVGKVSRSSACVEKLAELNSYVHVSTVSGDPLTMDLSAYSIVVCCCNSVGISRQIALNKLCRQIDIGFISADCYGLGGHIFVDFGPKFTSFDRDGEEVKSAIIAGLSVESDGVSVFTHNDKRHGFHDGDYVTFREVQGMLQLNASEWPIKVTGPYSFKIIMSSAQLSLLTPYDREGIVTQVKKPLDIAFISLEASQHNPVPPGSDGLPVWDLGKFGRPEQLHTAFRALRAWIDRRGGQLPPLRCPATVAEVLAESRAIDPEVDADVVRRLVAVANCEFGPMTSFMGGVVAQEVVKYTGKFHPLHQSLYFDMFEVLSEVDTDCYTCSPPNRYSDLAGIIGQSGLAKLHASSLFLVGSGALGCEFLKAFALAGIGKNGRVVVTDMDRIETSNLNRQFLFRSQHVGSQKSTTAAAAAAVMNPDFHCVPMEVRVGPETEDIFDDAFWESIDCVVNALDNVQARLYVDSRCVWFDKPLLESGTLGTKANVQVVIPNLTQSYGDSQDPPEESIPLCTLKNFPHQIEHTIEWARDLFHGLFTEVPGEGNSLLTTKDAFLAKLSAEGGSSANQVAKLVYMQSVLSVFLSGNRFEKCVEIAISEFTAKFDHSIAQLLHTFPIDHKTTEGGLFWSGPKRPPVPLRFDPRDEEHLNFIVSAANLIAVTLGMAPELDRAKIQAIASKVTVAPFISREMKIKADDKDTTIEGCASDEIELQRAISRLGELVAVLPNSVEFLPHEFEKDDDSNFHIDFIASAANLRARNYRIAEVDKFKVKLIAGKIIPAIATTTAMVVGLVTVELMKILTCAKHEIELFKNSFVNLALPVWILSEPSPPLKTVSKDMDPVTGGPVRAKPEGFTPWQKIIVDLPASATIADFIKFLADSQGLEVVIVSAGNACLYNAYLPTHKARLAKSLVTVFEEIAKAPLPKSKMYLSVEVSACDAGDGVDVIIPSIKYRIRK